MVGISGLFLIVLSTLLIIAVYRFRKIKLRNKILKNLIYEKTILEQKLNHSRENIAKDFHDDMGNKLARISLLSEVLIENEDILDIPLKNKLIQIKKDTDVLYKNTKDFIWALKSDTNNVNELITYLSDFGEDFFYSFKIDFEIEMNEHENLILPLNWNRQIVLVCKEIMTNAARHSGCTEVKLVFNVFKESLQIEVLDNGKGILEIEKKSERGIGHIIERINKLGGNLFFDTVLVGTHIKIILPLFGSPTLKG